MRTVGIPSSLVATHWTLALSFQRQSVNWLWLLAVFLWDEILPSCFWGLFHKPWIWGSRQKPIRMSWNLRKVLLPLLTWQRCWPKNWRLHFAPRTIYFPSVDDTKSTAFNGILDVAKISDVSENRGGPPKSSIFIGFKGLNHPFWGSPIFGNTHFCSSLATRWGIVPPHGSFGLDDLGAELVVVGGGCWYVVLLFVAVESCSKT